MNKNLKESLLIIMNRAAVPIEFTSAYVLSMNLDSFVVVSKQINLQCFIYFIIVYLIGTINNIFLFLTKIFCLILDSNKFIKKLLGK